MKIKILLLVVLSVFQLSARATGPAAIGDTSVLRSTVNIFLQKADSGKVSEILAMYDPGFVSVRVVDAGRFIKMDLKQMTWFWKSQSANMHLATRTKSTVIHDIDIIGDLAFVLLTRVKDLGSGPEPMFYTLVWKKRENQWYLLREIVHQRTMPKL